MKQSSTIVQKLYYAILKKLSPEIVTFLLGFASTILFTYLATTSIVPHYEKIMGLSLLCILGSSILLNIRLKTDKNYENLSDLAIASKTKWEKACNYSKQGRLTWFCSGLIVAIASAVLLIYLMLSNQKNEQAHNKRIETLNQNIETLKRQRDSLQQENTRLTTKVQNDAVVIRQAKSQLEERKNDKRNPKAKIKL